MNLKKILLKVVTSITIIMFALIPCSVFAKDATTPLYLGIQELRTNDTPNIGYAIGNPNSNGATGSAAKIWNILEYTSSNQNASLKAAGNKNIYCLKAGVGFGDVKRRETYNVFFDMKTEKDKIKAQNNVLKSIVEGTVPGNASNTTVNKYDAILAAVDMFYLPGQSEEKDKTELINTIIEEAKQPSNPYNSVVELMEGYPLTTDDITAVQQAVLWYFTNYGEENGKYDKTQDTNWLWYTEDGNTYKNLTDYTPNGLQPQYDAGAARSYQAQALYNYLIKTAKENAKNYSNPVSSEAPATLNTTALQYEELGSNYIIGPINITQKAGNSIPYTIDFTVKNGDTAMTNYKLLDNTKSEVSLGTTVKDLVGKDFYILVPKDSTTTISINTKINYNISTLELWTNKNTEPTSTQPVMIPNKKPVEVAKELKVIPKPTEYFDLKLIKRIVAVNNQNVPERITDKVDVSKLNKKDENGKIIATTGEYKLNKEPVGVRKGDIVTYTFRVYNEGTIDGYASKITEDIPEGLEFIYEDSNNQESLTDAEKEAIDFNNNALWTIDKMDSSTPKARVTQISTDYLSKAKEKTSQANLIKAFGENDGTKTENDISYKEVSVKLKVVSDSVGQIIRNEACISDDTDKDGNKVDDRDSDTEKWVKYEDDEDYDNIILQVFDLALRKFIIAVSDDNKIENSEYLKNSDGTYTREPKVDTSKLNTTGENGKMITTAIYNHTKEPVLVKQNDFIVYNLRVYNEGDIDGYASEIKDHLPPYLEFVDGEFNKQYGWSISEDGRTATTRYLENSKIDKAKKDKEGKYILAYKEVPIMCKVKENAKTSENITNIADITEYKDENKKDVTDRDSQADNVVLPKDEELPSYKETEKESYVPGQQDDDDFEKVIVKTFDLALRKWVTQAIVIDKNGQSVTQTGHQPYDDPEQVVKVELHRKKLNEVTVKFRYSIRVINEGEIAGYAKEVTDYVPQGLKFVAEDNQGWIDEGNNVISTKMLENTLLQPGDYKDVEVVLTWINSQDNMGVMINTAEISQDYNEYDIPDKDSTPDNQKPGEDDIDDAPVMLSISTGQMRIYFTLGFIVLITIAGGVVIIKKYVL